MREPVRGVTEAGRRREQRARETRRRIVEAGIRLFLERGYAATTVEAIAQDANVAPATVYQAFANKPAILAAGLDITIVGDTDPVALLDRDWVANARIESDPRRRLKIVVDHTSAVAARTAPIKEVMRDAAATEPVIRDLIRRDHENRKRAQRELVRVILGPAAGRKRVESAAATFFALVNSDTFRLCNVHLGWTLAEWRTWLKQVLGAELLDSKRPT